ncbi:MAG: hypothetical protein WC420_02715 [Candidatus Paceibacterota bacterium]|jgi:hypothetical protein
MIYVRFGVGKEGAVVLPEVYETYEQAAADAKPGEYIDHVHRTVAAPGKSLFGIVCWFADEEEPRVCIGTYPTRPEVEQYEKEYILPSINDHGGQTWIVQIQNVEPTANGED